MEQTVQLGISLEPMKWSAQDGDLILRTARKTESLGFHYVLMSGHMLKNQLGAALDPLVTLAAVVGATTSLRIATSVAVAPYYPPVLLANQAAALDVLSHGRFTLAVAAGWNPAEFAAVGVPVSERGVRTDEALQVLKELWSGRPVTLDGRFGSLRGAVGGVLPVTPGGPPLWVGGASDAALLRALRYAGGWHGGAGDQREVLKVKARLARLGERVGRDPATLDLTTVCFLVPPGFAPQRPAPGRLLGGFGPSAERLAEELGLLRQAGISLCSLWMPLSGAALSDALEWLASEILPGLE
jgi:probable F420-dependent oxidoreductase